MKWKFLIFIPLFLVIIGCTNQNINYMSIDEEIESVVSKDIKLYNNNNVGYRFYLPRNFTVKTNDTFNQILSNRGMEYYLYVDVVSYYNKKEYVYKKNDNAYIDKTFNGLKGKGELYVLKKDKDFLIKLCYNYAIIEVRVDSESLKNSIVYMLSILNSIQYNDAVISNLVGSNNILDAKEKKYGLFIDGTNDEHKNVLEVDKDPSKRDPIDNIKDPDLITNNN
ncbi:MAG: hypothetical protein RSB41_02215 [Bacilli bacterium]